MKHLIGQQIENYLIQDTIGDGGMGTVYRALDVDLARPVALKIMHPQYAAQETFQDRFQQEARAAARLNHPSIVQIYRFGRRDGYLFIVMELIEGTGLGVFMRRLAEEKKVMRLNEGLLVVAQVADALGYAARRGVIHRDVKPDNILVKKLDHAERTGELPLRAVVTDFGLAKLMEGGIQTQTGTFIGTLPYMSPEQVLGKPIDGRSDIYSLGVVLYELVTGQLPFDIRTPTDAVLQHMNNQPPEPRLIQPGLPFVVEEVILTALAKTPDYRYQTSAQMAEALRRAATQVSETDVTAFGRLIPQASILTAFDSPARAKTTPQKVALPHAVEIVPPPAPPDSTPEPATPQTPPPPTPAKSPRPAAKMAPPSPVADPPPTPQISPIQAPPPLLPDAYDRVTVSHKTDEPRTYLLDKPQICIGRSPDNELVLPSMGVSHHHALLEQTANGWQVTDRYSTNGVHLGNERVPPGQAVPWSAEKRIRISDYWLELIPRHPTPPKQAAPDETQLDAHLLQPPAEAETGQIRVNLPLNLVTALPGQAVDLPIRIHHRGQFAVALSIKVSGVPPTWITHPPRLVQLAPGEQEDVPVTIQPPAGMATKAGRYPLQIQVNSQVGPEEVVTATGELLVSPVYDFTLRLTPLPQMTGQQGAYQAEISNQSNSPLNIQFSIDTADRTCRFNFDPPRLVVPYLQTGTAVIQVQPKEVTAVSQSIKHPFTLIARVADAPQVQHQATETWEQHPLRRVITAQKEKETKPRRLSGCLTIIGGLLLTLIMTAVALWLFAYLDIPDSWLKPGILGLIIIVGLLFTLRGGRQLWKGK